MNKTKMYRMKCTTITLLKKLEKKGRKESFANYFERFILMHRGMTKHDRR